jgi:hypothetical protein
MPSIVPSIAPLTHLPGCRIVTGFDDGGLGSDPAAGSWSGGS